ncbi:MAG: homoprotocatechuate degradation operon regulator HpaR [Marinovum sp.]|nr:homoprotocatechuate degradation operon regulator HpaR [Marinovum sp.]
MYDPTSRSLPISLLQTRELIMEVVRPMLVRHSITEQQWRVLRVISEDVRLDASTVAARACLLAPSVTRIVRALEKRGFISSVRDVSDKRRTVLQLTEAGDAFLEKVSPESAEIFAKLRRTVGAERWEQLTTLLSDIRSDIQATDSDQSDAKP